MCLLFFLFPALSCVYLQGWTDKYNDWRPYHSDSELHKHDEEGKRLMDEAKLKMKEANKKNKAGGAAAEESSGKSGKKKRVSVDDDTVSDEVTVGGASGEVKLKISGHLKKQLINDWEQVTRSHKLVSLPRPITVKMLLSEFEQSKTKQETSHQMVKEVVAGVEQYFEKALGTVLLYRFERPQFKVNTPRQRGAESRGRDCERGPATHTHVSAALCSSFCVFSNSKPSWRARACPRCMARSICSDSSVRAGEGMIVL